MHNFLENKYSDFTETDFINDPYFQDWMISSDEDVEKFWSEFLQSYPQKKEMIEAAKRFLQNVRFDEEALDERYIHQQYLQHLSRVQTKKQAKILGINIKAIGKVAAAAAILAIVLIASIVFYTKTADEILVVRTGYGEIKKVFLPDGSNIVLNGHSNVSFAKEWHGNKPREIWLRGEGFIDVLHLNTNESDIKTSERFIVHGDGFTIEVLGTSFDIRQRRGKTEVVLQTGKIKLTLKDRPSPITMLPGDIVSYEDRAKVMIKSKTVAENYSGWKEQKLILNNPTLEEITSYLEDNYGKKIIIDNKKIRTKKIEGVIQLNNLNDALFIISTVLNTEIQTKKNVIVIKSK